jgi:hypothetical protein
VPDAAQHKLRLTYGGSCVPQLLPRCGVPRCAVLQPANNFCTDKPRAGSQWPSHATSSLMQAGPAVPHAAIARFVLPPAVGVQTAATAGVLGWVGKCQNQSVLVIKRAFRASWRAGLGPQPRLCWCVRGVWPPGSHAGCSTMWESCIRCFRLIKPLENPQQRVQACKRTRTQLPLLRPGCTAPAAPAGAQAGHMAWYHHIKARSTRPSTSPALVARPVRTQLEPHNNFWLCSSAYVSVSLPLPSPQRSDTYPPPLTLTTRPQRPQPPLTPPVVELSNHVWKGSQGPVWQGCQGHHG